MIDSFTLGFPIWVEFGRGVSGTVGEIADSKDWESAVVVTDPGIVDAGLLTGIEGSLDSAGVSLTVYDGVAPNPTVSMVEEATEVVTSTGCDFVVGVGGGSTMDVAKTAAMLATNPGDVREYEVANDENQTPRPIETHPLPLVTVPTTAGTGSEVDFWAVITDEEREFKMALGQSPSYPGGPYLGASVSLVDPALTTSLPPRQTAATGFDALSHALENYLSAARSPFVEPITLHVMREVAENLPRAFESGDIEAREHMSYAAAFAGICENFAGFGAIHSLAEVTGGMYPDVPHGEAIAIFTPPVMEYNRQTDPGPYRAIAEALGRETAGMTDREASAAAVAAVESLIDRVDLPTSLRERGVDEADLPEIARKSMKTSEIADNPREASAEALLEIAREAY